MRKSGEFSGFFDTSNAVSLDPDFAESVSWEIRDRVNGFYAIEFVNLSNLLADNDQRPEHFFLPKFPCRHKGLW